MVVAEPKICMFTYMEGLFGAVRPDVWHFRHVFVNVWKDLPDKFTSKFQLVLSGIYKMEKSQEKQRMGLTISARFMLISYFYIS